jgi:tRNA-dihydrouridine synthase B
MSAGILKIGAVSLSDPVALAPMAGMTDSAFRRLVKRRGGCGLVVTEMVSSEGLVRGIDRTLEYAEYTEEERPVAIQIFGGDPKKMADAAQIVEGMGADIVDVNMGCPVPKIAKHNAGCSLMREPAHAAQIIGAMAKAVKIPVTVKMRAGWNETSINAPDLAQRVQDAGAGAVAVHGRTAAQSYTGESDWTLIRRVAESVTIPVLGSGDCVESDHVASRLRDGGVAGVLVGRGALRNPWIFQQSSASRAGLTSPSVSPTERGIFLLEYLDLLLREYVDEAAGFRHVAPGQGSIDGGRQPPARGRERWIINKLRALNAWYSKGFEGGSEFRVAINMAQSIDEVRQLIADFFCYSTENDRHLDPVTRPIF